MDRSDEKKRIIQHLNDRGYESRLDDDGDVVFSKEGANFWIILDPGDSTLYQIVVPGVELFKNETDVTEGNRTALQTVRQVKGVKAFLQNDTLLCFAVDIGGVDFEAFKRRLEPAVDACLLASQLYSLERGEQTVVRAVSLLNSLGINKKENS